MATLSSFVFNVNSENPIQIGPSLSASNNSVVFLQTDSTWKVIKYIDKNLFTSLNTYQLTAITLSNHISGFWNGWLSAGVALGSKFTQTAYKELTGVYSSFGGILSTQLWTLTSSVLSTSEFGCGKLAGTILYPSGVLFDTISNPVTSTVVLSAANNIRILVSQSYHNKPMALYFDDSSTALFIVNTAATGNQTISGLSFDVRGPNEIRRFAIEG
jgi:hypothetical protein